MSHRRIFHRIGSSARPALTTHKFGANILYIIDCTLVWDFYSFHWHHTFQSFILAALVFYTDIVSCFLCSFSLALSKFVTVLGELFWELPRTEQFVDFAWYLHYLLPQISSDFERMKDFDLFLQKVFKLRAIENFQKCVTFAGIASNGHTS